MKRRLAGNGGAVGARQELGLELELEPVGLELMW